MIIARMHSSKPKEWPAGDKRSPPKLPEASTCDKRLYIPEYKSMEEVSCKCRQLVDSILIFLFIDATCP